MGVFKLIDRYSLGAAVYTIVAVLSAASEWITFFVFQKIVDAFTAAIFAFFVATTLNYILSRKVAFNSSRTRREEIALLFLLSGLAFLFNFGAFALLYTYFEINPITAKVVGTGAGFCINYFARQFIIFSPNPKFPEISKLYRRPVIAQSRGTTAASGYEGHRILEAMRSAPRYAEAIYLHIRSAYNEKAPAVLDFGAGDGVFVDKFLREGIEVDCVEPDLSNQTRLRAFAGAVVSDVGVLPSERYDLVYTINVLEHLKTLDRYLAELNRVLRPSGRLFVFVPAFNILWTSLDTEVGHIQRFTRRTLVAQLSAAGFEVKSVRYFDSAGFFAALAIRMLEKLGLFHYSSKSIGFYDRVILPFSLFSDRFLCRIAGKNLMAIVEKTNNRTAGAGIDPAVEHSRIAQ